MPSIRPTVLLSFLLAGSSVQATVLNQDPHAFDAEFHHGATLLDRFHSPFTQHREGERILRLSDGDLLVAGRVKLAGHGSNGNSIGLSRYAPDGSPRQWNEPEPLFQAGDRYLVWPTTPGAGDNVNIARQIEDLRQLGDRILVLYSTRYPRVPPPSPYPNDSRLDLRVFDLDGRLLPSSQIADDQHAWGLGAAMLAYSYQSVPHGQIAKVIVAYTHGQANSSDTRIRLRRYQFDGPGGPPLPDFSFNNGSYSRDYNLATACAGYASAWHGAGVVLAASGTRGPNPRLYLGNTIWNPASGSRDVAVLAVNGGTSAPVAEFGNACSSGFRVAGFDNGGSLHDEVVDIVSTDPLGLADPVIHVLARVDRDCEPGVGVLRLNHNGFPSPSFGSAGRVVFGGTGAIGPSCPLPFLRTADIPTAITRSGDRLAIAGHSDSELFGGEQRRDPLFAIVDANTAAVREFRLLPARKQADGVRVGDAEYRDILVDNQGRLAMVGRAFDGTILPTGYQRFATARLRSDRIFGQGFD